MKLDSSTLLFFDASCLIAASSSPTGGSRFLLSLCSRSLLRGAVSHYVLLESERNIRVKMHSRNLDSYHKLLQRVPLLIAPVPEASRRVDWQHIVNRKDHHVVEAVLACKADYLISLDRRLNEQFNQANLTVSALTPGEFIKSALIHHVEYESLR